MKSIIRLLPLLFLAATTAAELPKSIVLILADDLGWADTTRYGKTSLCETPNIERLAARGMTFSSAKPKGASVGEIDPQVCSLTLLIQEGLSL